MTWRQFPDSKVHGAIMGPIWGRQGPGEPHVGPMNFAIWIVIDLFNIFNHNDKMLVLIEKK